ncbi:MAG: hypothetical protein EBZ50_06120, partial [Alphaproteobacteria bacterium]|nr:hypothetical protein [Alphaproteobacteria bacterium]
MPTLINRLLSHRDRLAEAVRFVEHLGVRPGLSAFWRSRNGRPANSSESGSLDVDVASLARPLTQVLVDLAAHFGADADPIGLSIALPRVDGDLDARAAPIALARLGLQARWSLTPLLEIEALHLPAALELADGGYLLVATRPDPETLEVRNGDGATRRIALASLVPRVTGRLLVLGAADPINGATDADDRAALAKGPRRWILLRFLQDRAIVGQLILASVILNLCSLAMPLFQRAIYDRVIPNLALDSLWALSIGAVIALAFEFALRGARSNFIEAQGLRVAQQVQARVMTAVLQAQLAKAPRNTGAALVASAIGPAIMAIAATKMRKNGRSTRKVAIAMIAGPIALCVVAGAAALVVIGLASLKGAGAASARNIQLSRARNNLVVDVVDGLSTIKANQAEGKFARQWAVVCDHLAMSGHDVRKTSEVAMSASGFAVQAVTVAAIIVGVLLVKAGDLSAGALIASTLLAGRAMAPISTAVALSTRAYQSLSQFKAMAELLALP